MTNNSPTPHQPHSPQPVDASPAHHDAAANVVRQQLDQIYGPEASQQSTKEENPYQRTANENFDWQNYHTEWQKYYQQYYQRYYWQQLHAERQKLTPVAQPETSSTEVTTGVDPAALRKTQMQQLKADVTEKVRERAKKARKSHHFVPIVSALAVGFVFLFLQFNGTVIAQVKAYVSPGAIAGDAIITDPSTSVNVGPEPKLIIPKINVEVPVDYGVQGLSESDIQTSLRDGATHYRLPGANAVPGQFGNTVILGHSSNDIFNQGKYKFVFVLLDRLEPGDTFYLHYNSKRYIYKLTEKKVINPNEISALQIGDAKPMATLVTCTPPGTALKRLLIYAEQISPDPAGDAPKQTADTTPANNDIPGNEPSILEQIWGFFF